MKIQMKKIIYQLRKEKQEKVKKMTFFFKNNSALITNGFFIKQTNSYKKILFEDITYVEASRSYSYIHLLNGKKLLVTQSLSKFKLLPLPIYFKQIHRSYLINLNIVNSITGNLVCIEKAKIPVSKPYRNLIKNHFIFLE